MSNLLIVLNAPNSPTFSKLCAARLFRFQWRENLQTELVLLGPFLFYLGFTSCKAEQPLTRHGVTRKVAQKRLQDAENLFRKNLQLKDVC